MFGRNPPHIAKHPVVSLDFDGVLAHAYPLKVKYAKEWFGVKLELSQTKEKAFDELMKRKGLPYRYRTDLAARLNKEHLMEYAVPKGCKKALHALEKEGFRFVVVTSRNDWELKRSKLFLKKRFGGLITHVHNTSDEPKDRFVRRLHTRIHLDDDLFKLKALAGCATELCWYRQPENHHLNTRSQRITQIHNWEEFAHHCRALRELHEAVCWRFGIKNTWHHAHEIFDRFHALSEADRHVLLDRYRAR